MRALRPVLLSICAVLLSTAIAPADGNMGIVYVHVMDAKTGRPVSGWTVQVTGRDGDSQALTGGSGQATFLSVAPGLARIDVLQRGELGACPAVIMISANQQTVVNVHVRRSSSHQIGCSSNHAQTMVKTGVTSDVYDIY